VNLRPPSTSTKTSDNPHLPPPTRVTAPSAANTIAAVARIAFTGSLSAILSPMSTAGMFANIMPSVVPRTDRIELLELRGEPNCRDLRLVADFSEKESTQGRHEGPRAADSPIIALVFVGEESPHGDAGEGGAEDPSRPRPAEQ